MLYKIIKNMFGWIRRYLKREDRHTHTPQQQQKRREMWTLWWSPYFSIQFKRSTQKNQYKCHLKPFGTWISNFLTYTYSTFIQFWIFALQNEVIKPTINGVLSIMKACVNAKTVRRLVFTSSAGTVNVEEHIKPVYDEKCWTDVEFVRKKKMTGWVSIYFLSFCLSFVIFINFPLKIPLFWFVSNFVW